MLVLRNTLYLNAALAALLTEGQAVRDEDVVLRSSLSCEHVNLLGRNAFSMPESVRCGELRGLRNPGAVTDDNAP